MPDKLISDRCRIDLWPKRHVGTAVCGSPFEMLMTLDFTGPRGSGSNIYWKYVYQIPKWQYSIFKVDEWIEVTPEWAEYYSMTMGQKQKLMESIKSGLMSAAEAVSGYELLAHDSRRYKEILDYFELGKTDEHVLRSLFVDRIDAYTGEGYSMISMSKRWPTIISDFIRMKGEWTDPGKISDPKEQLNKLKKELDVSHAEATVLKTKNELFREWKKMVLPQIQERYARIENMARARKKSIDEYKSWLKPYLARHKMMKEKLEVKPSEYISSAYMVPGFGQSQALTGTKLWMWKVFPPAELRKAEFGPLKTVKYRSEEGGKPVGKKVSFAVDPYDKIVKKYCRMMEERYDVGLYLDYDDMVKRQNRGEKIRKHKMFVRDILNDTYTKKLLDPHIIYYVFFETTILLCLSKTPPPESVELDDLMIDPIRGWFMSQNIILIHIIELKVRELHFDRYIDEMVGGKKIEEDILKEIRGEFEGKKPENVSALYRLVDKIRMIKEKFNEPIDNFIYIFIKRGPYETTFYERVSKLYARGMGGFYGQQINFLKEKMGVGKF